MSYSVIVVSQIKPNFKAKENSTLWFSCIFRNSVCFCHCCAVDVREAIERDNRKATMPLSLEGGWSGGVGGPENRLGLHFAGLWAGPINAQAQRPLHQQRGGPHSFLPHLELSSLFLLLQRLAHWQRPMWCSSCHWQALQSWTQAYVSSLPPFSSFGLHILIWMLVICFVIKVLELEFYLVSVLSLYIPEHGFHAVSLHNQLYFFNFLPFCYLYFLNRMCVLFVTENNVILLKYFALTWI